VVDGRHDASVAPRRRGTRPSARRSCAERRVCRREHAAVARDLISRLPPPPSPQIGTKKLTTRTTDNLPRVADASRHLAQSRPARARGTASPRAPKGREARIPASVLSCGCGPMRLGR
jgi:hypothetical protein